MSITKRNVLWFEKNSNRVFCFPQDFIPKQGTVQLQNIQEQSLWVDEQSILPFEASQEEQARFQEIRRKQSAQSIERLFGTEPNGSPEKHKVESKEPKEKKRSVSEIIGTLKSLQNSLGGFDSDSTEDFSEEESSSAEDSSFEEDEH